MAASEKVNTSTFVKIRVITSCCRGQSTWFSRPTCGDALEGKCRVKWNIDGHIRLAKPSRPDPRFVLSDALAIGVVSTSRAQPTFILQAAGSPCAPTCRWVSNIVRRNIFVVPAWFAHFALEIVMSSSCCLHHYRWTSFHNLLLRVDGRTVSPLWKGNRKCTHIVHAIAGVVRWPMIQ